MSSDRRAGVAGLGVLLVTMIMLTSTVMIVEAVDTRTSLLGNSSQSSLRNIDRNYSRQTKKVNLSCGDRICQSGETVLTCPEDCGTCGDGICDSTESDDTCFIDCVCTGEVRAVVNYTPDSPTWLSPVHLSGRRSEPAPACLEFNWSSNDFPTKTNAGPLITHNFSGMTTGRPPPTCDIGPFEISAWEVTLRVANPHGNSDTVTRCIDIGPIGSPVAVIDTNVTRPDESVTHRVFKGETIQIDAYKSHDTPRADGTVGHIVNYSFNVSGPTWQFDEPGGPLIDIVDREDKSFNVDLSKQGYYKIHLWVKDNMSFTDRDHVTIHAEINNQPEARFDINSQDVDNTFVPWEKITINAFDSNSGDGNADRIVNYTYRVIGPLDERDPNFDEGPARIDDSPISLLRPDCMAGPEPHDFNDESDSVPAEGPCGPKHSFKLIEPGHYKVKLTVRDTEGQTASLVKPFAVESTRIQKVRLRIGDKKMGWDMGFNWVKVFNGHTGKYNFYIKVSGMKNGHEDNKRKNDRYFDCNGKAFGKWFRSGCECYWPPYWKDGWIPNSPSCSLTRGLNGVDQIANYIRIPANAWKRRGYHSTKGLGTGAGTYDNLIIKLYAQDEMDGTEGILVDTAKVNVGGDNYGSTKTYCWDDALSAEQTGWTEGC